MAGQIPLSRRHAIPDGIVSGECCRSLTPGGFSGGSREARHAIPDGSESGERCSSAKAPRTSRSLTPGGFPGAGRQAGHAIPDGIVSGERCPSAADGVSGRTVIIAPSLLSADPLDIAGSIARLGAAPDWIHVDIMDGHFVPNLSYGPSIVRALAGRRPSVIRDVHLMVEPPERFFEAFCDAGSTFVTVHAEATPHIHRVLSAIRERGCRPGISLNPGTPIETIFPVIHMVDLVLVMSVDPGFGGQGFIPETLNKTVDLVRLRTVRGLSFFIEMDGGLGIGNLESVIRHGCDVIVMGNALFGAPDPGAAWATVNGIAKEATIGD